MPYAIAAAGAFASSLPTSRALAGGTYGSCSAVTRYTPRPESLGDGYQFRFSFSPSALVSQQPGGILASRLLPKHRQGACILSDDHWYSGLIWNLVIARDGFVGVTWRVCVDPQGKQSVEPAAWPMGRAEVGVVFSIWLEEDSLQKDTSSYLVGNNRSGSSSGNSSSSSPAAAGSSARRGLGDTAAAAAAASGKKAMTQAFVPVAVAGGSPSSTTRKQQQQLLAQGSVKRLPGLPALGPRYERAYREPQFIPAECAWGFAQFLEQGPVGQRDLLSCDVRITLGCRIKLCD
jgi:hypothetical protein